MSDDVAAHERRAGHARFVAGTKVGHYESWFTRGNHPTRPLAFWIRYTIFSPRGRPEAAEGELWAIVFDGETGRHVAVERDVPIASTHFARDAFEVRVDDAALGPASLRGAVTSADHRLAWDLAYRTDERPLFLFPLGLYDAKLPRAKSLVGAPLSLFEGSIDVDGRALDVTGWLGSQNHNWGSRHTDAYAWGQVAGFDGEPRTFLELGTGRLKVGPLWTPNLTPVVLRHRGREHALNAPLRLARAEGKFDYFTYRFASEDARVRLEGTLRADREDFVGLAYRNPPGGEKHCLNTKIATCDLTIAYKAGTRAGEVEHLVATRRAAFEILTDDRAHGITIAR
jgi:hypothetical protein